ncbi:hypothetical protein SAY86_007241 [Trapa natans]|uniref:Uncharacterized protein n=1 Tax=Trapa natans TaxID=22666 RepID=A0AAN7QXN6_TRANT|nr:hypothetical protein SAY86_007241 [Trapa natans]
MGKGPGLYTDIGKKARDLLYKDYQSDQKFTITTYSPTGVAITSTGIKKGQLLLADVNTQLKNKNITTDIKVDTNSNLSATITLDEPAPGLKTIFSFKVPDQRSGKFEVQYLHEHAGISSSIGLTANPVVNFSGVIGLNLLALGTDVSFDTKTGNFTKYDAGLSFSNADLVASLTLNDKGDSLNASYYHIVNPLTNTAVGAEVAHSFSTNVNTITVGTQHALDPLTTVKARVNNSGKATALVQHEWRPKSFFTISGEFGGIARYVCKGSRGLHPQWWVPAPIGLEPQLKEMRYKKEVVDPRKYRDDLLILETAMSSPKKRPDFSLISDFPFSLYQTLLQCLLLSPSPLIS